MISTEEREPADKIALRRMLRKESKEEDKRTLQVSAQLDPACLRIAAHYLFGTGISNPQVTVAMCKAFRFVFLSRSKDGRVAV